ncbi:MAG: M50 family peptidase [Streptosporangiales bacterium]|nr:M50 family peptidase [Streptosporangiales bacterium]
MARCDPLRSARSRPEVPIPPLIDLWQRLVGTQPDPPSWILLGSGALALVTVVSRRTWPVFRNVVTIAHEGGHALVALVTRRRLSGIRLHSDASGVTVSRGKPTGPGMFFTTAAGYVSPSLLGLGGALTLAGGHITALLWMSIALLAAMLVAIRNAFGVASILGTGVTIFLVSWLTSPTVQAAFGYLFTWFLLLGGVRPVMELQRLRRHRRAPHSDADQLARLTGVPGGLWVAVFALITIATLVAGGRWLLDGAGVLSG